eukprot:gnl/Spiro4/14855_TR8004_c0_g1_i1.p1 gnl/Spiro4/14855_TR8004_c0_g1~~gnl/Spiro4/14855_TR8004_c0_g1_i1.p1  ORF type:complete len:466 (-),score=147.27 gnl/Spiro4/14855_TR8004_c0_g1_i1:525-1922(-)
MASRFFVCKAKDFRSLRTATELNVWAVRPRATVAAALQPSELLRHALAAGPVVLLFSVDGSQRWQGVARMTCAPGEWHGTFPAHASDPSWQPFGVQWVVPASFAAVRDLDSWGLPFAHVAAAAAASAPSAGPQQQHQQQQQHAAPAIATTATGAATTTTTTTTTTLDANSARNMQELGAAEGQMLVTLLTQFEANYFAEIARREAEREASRPPAFYTENPGDTVDLVWAQLTDRVCARGTILVACAMGSGRYNTSVPDSDVDFYIVYVAPTAAVLSLQPPEHTLKNRSSEKPDFTVNEVFRFCQLLAEADPRTVETLFLHPDDTFRASEHFAALRDIRDDFLSKQLVDKYLRDACGSSGIVKAEKCAARDPERAWKTLYIVYRLLQNALQVASSQSLTVRRDTGSAERAQLMAIRAHEGGSLASYIEGARALQAQVAAALSANTTLRNIPDVRRLDAWLLRVRLG